jgi:signal transduction histidine kinase
MKTSRSLLIWATLALCGVMVLGAMTWLTRGALASERERAVAEARADLEERTRLALWRMDALGAAISTRENGYGPDKYQVSWLEIWRTRPPAVRLHFQSGRQGITSPEVGIKWNLADHGVDSGALGPGREPTAEDAIVEGHLKWLREFLKTQRSSLGEWAFLNEAAEQGEATWQAVPKDAPQEQDFKRDQRAQKPGAQVRNSSAYQQSSNVSERAQRAKAMAQNMLQSMDQQEEARLLSLQVDAAARDALGRDPTTNSLSGILVPGNPPLSPADKVDNETVLEAMSKDHTANNPSGIIDAGAMTEKPSRSSVDQLAQSLMIGGETIQLNSVGQMRPVWLGDELFLLRQVTWDAFDFEKKPAGQRNTVQGVWFNAGELQELFLREVADLLPEAKLVRVEGKQAASDPLSLVSFPFRLVRNETIVAPVSISPALLIGWIAVLLALLTAAFLVHGVMRLSERRASFVSAVTHELRTPLTTFRLYADMLESGAVKPEKRGDYLRVLSREADRLSHLVENVLSFSKIERGSARSVVRETSVSGLLEPMRERLHARLATAGLTLEMDTASNFPVRVDAAAVEHILFNLIDNAAKYAAAGDPPKVEISVKSKGRHLDITVSDHGPGIPASERGRIFRAFHKSAREAAESRPGVGLGLALSRRLAKSLGGGLECVDSEQGACFILRLPLA